MWPWIISHTDLLTHLPIIRLPGLLQKTPSSSPDFVASFACVINAFHTRQMTSGCEQGGKAYLFNALWEHSVQFQRMCLFPNRVWREWWRKEATENRGWACEGGVWERGWRMSGEKLSFNIPRTGSNTFPGTSHENTYVSWPLFAKIYLICSPSCSLEFFILNWVLDLTSRVKVPRIFGRSFWKSASWALTTSSPSLRNLKPLSL